MAQQYRDSEYASHSLAEAVPGTWERIHGPTRVVGTRAAQDSGDLQERIRIDAFLLEARERFRISADAENKRRTEMLVDLKFSCGEQWDKWVELMRRQQGRPCLTINRMPGFIKHVVNNMRQARPEIKVDPIGDGADEEIAEIRQGLIRHIELVSRASIAYDTAFESMCTMGLGYLRVVDGWAGAQSFDKELFIQWVPNPFSVYYDPSASKPDWSDARYCFIVEDMSLAEFKARYGRDKQAASLSNFQSVGDHAPFWIPGGKVRVAEYFHVEEEEDTLCELSDGTICYFSELEAAAMDLGPESPILQNRPTVVRRRPVKRPRVVWTLMSGLDILMERDWPGKYIPVIPVVGNQTELDGERILVGMVRYAREPQRMYNYMYTSYVETVALAPKAPFVGEVDQISEFRDMWERSNTDPQAVLLYRNKSADNGGPLPPPQRQQAEPPIAAFVTGLKMADDNLKAVFSIYEASLGQKGPQESGIAINSRKIESDVATYDWVDNFTRALTYLGIVLDDLLPHYYNGEGRIVQILREDDTKKLVTLNQRFTDDKGKEKVYDLTQGKFAIVMGTGPSATTRRQEAAKAMLELAKIYPPIMQAAGPTIIREMDWPGKDAIAAQLEKTMPPELRTQDKEEGQGPNQEQLQQTLAQAMSQIQTLSKLLGEATDATQAEERKQLWDTFRTQMQQETQLAIAQMKTGSSELMMLNGKLFEEMERIRLMFEQMAAGQQPGQPAQPSSPGAAAQPQANPGSPGGGVSSPATPGGGVGTSAPTA